MTFMSKERNKSPDKNGLTNEFYDFYLKELNVSCYNLATGKQKKMKYFPEAGNY